MDAPLRQAVEAGVGALGGLLLGLGFFGALRFNLDLYLAGGKVWRGALLHVVRLAALAGGLALISRAGALALVAAFAGFLFAREIATRRPGRAS